MKFAVLKDGKITTATDDENVAVRAYEAQCAALVDFGEENGVRHIELQDKANNKYIRVTLEVGKLEG